MKFSHLLFFALAVVCWTAVPDRAQAGLLEAQYNPVPANFANGTTWHTLANWAGIPQYPADPTGDTSPADGYDWYYTQVAHNDDWFFIHYHNSHDFQGDRQLMYFDIDLNRNTGLQGFTGNLAVGAEFYLTGAAFNTGGSTFLGWINWAQSQDGNGDWDIFVAIDRATFMPGVTSFNFVNQNHDSAGDDWYPDAGNSGAGGDYFRYGTTPSGVDVTVENTDLKVTVNAATGTIAVFDKANGLTWNKRNNGAHGPFLNVSSTVDTITFNTTFTANPAVVCTIQVILSGRKVTFTCDADPAAAINGFDFLEPWQATGSMEYFMGEFTDGVIRPVTDNSWPYNLDNTIGVQNFTMPFIGILDPATGAGYSVVWETAADAAVKMAKFNGLRTPLTYWRSEKGKFGYQRRLSYNFTASGGYVELAKTYRNDYAAPQGLVVPLAEKAQTNPNITKLYGTAEIWDLVHLISDPELAAMGVQKVVHQADWKNAGRAAAIDYANNLGYVTSEYDYHTAGPVDEQNQAYVDWSHSYHIKTADAAKKADESVIPVGSWGLRCSSDFLEEGQRLVPPRLLEVPCTARYVDQMTQNIWGHDSLDGHTAECFDTSHPRTRSGWVADAIAFYDYLKTLGNSYDGLPLITGAELGKYYQVPNTELFFGIETHWWPWDFGFPEFWGDGGGTTTWDLWESTNLDPTKRIPLWSLVFGDCAIATLYPWDSIDACYKLPENELRIQGVKDAQLILNGAPPLFLSVDHPLGFGSSPWNAGDTTKPYRSRWLQSYRNVAHGHTYLADKEMINHTWLTADRKVQRTDWSDGTATIVNFGTSDYTTPDGSVLKRNGFWSVGPWGSSIKAYDNAAGREITSLQSNGYFFDDTQVNSTPVPLSIWQKDPNYLRVNVDRYCSNDSFVIKPLLVQETWDFGTTRVYQVDVTTNTISGEIPWTPSGNDGIAVSGLSGWVALDVISCNSSTANPGHSPWLCDSTQSTSCTQWLPGPVEVNCSDVALLKRNWLESACGDCNGADLTGDDEVNAADLMVVTDHWLCSLVPPPVLTAYWKFDEDSGNHADDVVSGHQGRLENMNLNTAWVSGKYGSACNLTESMTSSVPVTPAYWAALPAR